MKFTRCADSLFFLLILVRPVSLLAQSAQTATNDAPRNINSPLGVASVTVSPGCNGNRFNLESRTNPLPQTTESVDFLLNRVGFGVDLVVGAANDQRSSIGGFDAYYVHRRGTTCGVDFEGTLSTAAIDPVVVADAPRDAFFLADVLLSLSQIVEVARSTATTLLSTTACPSGTQLNGRNPNCWPTLGVANFTNSNISQAFLFGPRIAVDPRTSGTGAGDVYVVAEFENTMVFPAVANVQIIACTNLTLVCGSPVVVSGTDTFGASPYVQVRRDGVITISYETFTRPFGTQPNPIDIKFVTCKPQGAPKPPVCSTPLLVATSNVSGLFVPGDSGFHDILFPKHANRLETNGTYTTFLVYDRCQSIIKSVDAANPPCSKVDVVFAFSTNNGATWSVPQAVELGTGHQFFGTVRNDTSTDTINIAYFSTQDDFFLQRANVRLRQIAPHSTALGPPSILTATLTDPDSGVNDIIEPGGQGYIDFGDGIGLAVSGTGTVGGSKAYVHYTWNNVFGTFNGTSQPDQNNTLLSVSY